MDEFCTKTLYTAEDLKTLAHQNTLPGSVPPFRRLHRILCGPFATNEAWQLINKPQIDTDSRPIFIAK